MVECAQVQSVEKQEETREKGGKGTREGKYKEREGASAFSL